MFVKTIMTIFKLVVIEIMTWGNKHLHVLHLRMLEFSNKKLHIMFIEV